MYPRVAVVDVPVDAVSRGEDPGRVQDDAAAVEDAVAVHGDDPGPRAGFRGLPSHDARRGATSPAADQTGKGGLQPKCSNPLVCIAFAVFFVCIKVKKLNIILHFFHLFVISG